jgi:hypothetical protein
VKTRYSGLIAVNDRPADGGLGLAGGETGGSCLAGGKPRLRVRAGIRRDVDGVAACVREQPGATAALPSLAWLVRTKCDSEALDSDVIAIAANGQRLTRPPG